MTGEFCIAVHALVYLQHRGSTISSDVIAANVCTNPARIRKVMAKLKKSGLVNTHEGSEGGYEFVLDPTSVSLEQVCAAVDARMVSSGWRSGGKDCDCLIASGMTGVMDSLYARLDGCCMNELSHIMLADVQHRIFDGACNCADNSAPQIQE